MHVTPEEIGIALDFWRRNVTGHATVREVIQMALGNYHTNAALAIEGVIATGWVKGLLDQLEGRAVLEDLPPPKEFKGKLRPYQIRGYSWLKFLRKWGLGACLADDMGLGKTIQALALLQLDREEGVHRPTLLICPTSVVGNWQKEAARFTPKLKSPAASRHWAARRATTLPSWPVSTRWSSPATDCCSATWTRSSRCRGPASSWTKRRTSRTRRRGRRGRRAPWNGGLPHRADRHAGRKQRGRTVVGDGVPEPGLPGHARLLPQDILRPDSDGPRPAMSAAICRRLTAPFMLRRLKTDTSIIADLPEKMENKVFCTLTKEQATLYEEVAKDAYRLIETADGIGRARGDSGDAVEAEAGVQPSGALPGRRFADHRPQRQAGAADGNAGRGDGVRRPGAGLHAVHARWARFCSITCCSVTAKRCCSCTAAHRSGSVTMMVERFQNAPNGPRIFILSLKAGGTGLNLTRANHVFHFDRWWNPAVENQATDRAFRIGQKSNVQVHKFVCVGTLEERIDEMIERKKSIVKEVIGSGEQWITELSNEELKSVFALSGDAVEEG